MSTSHLLASRLVRHLPRLEPFIRRLGALITRAPEQARAADARRRGTAGTIAHDAIEVLVLPPGACRWLRVRGGDRLLVRGGSVDITVDDAAQALAVQAGIAPHRVRVASGEDWRADASARLRIESVGRDTARCLPVSPSQASVWRRRRAIADATRGGPR